MRRVSTTQSDDPLAQIIAPPPDETDEQRVIRIEAEEEARRVSDKIDEEISQQRLAAKRNPKPVKVLLLGMFSPPRHLRPPINQRVQAKASQVCTCASAEYQN